MVSKLVYLSRLRFVIGSVGSFLFAPGINPRNVQVIAIDFKLLCLKAKKLHEIWLKVCSENRQATTPSVLSIFRQKATSCKHPSKLLPCPTFGAPPLVSMPLSRS